jgi:class 3 adenylate cyclase
MAVSLSWIIGGMVVIIIIIVSSVSMALVLTVTRSALAAVGEALASQMATSVQSKIAAYFDGLELLTVSLNNLVYTEIGMLPTDFTRITGRNWTVPLIPQMLHVLFKANFSYQSLALGFYDDSWLYGAPSARVPGAVVVEWWEARNGPSQPSTGGMIRHMLGSGVEVPYDASTNFVSESQYARIDTRPFTTPDAEAFRNRLAQIPRRPQCLWLNVALLSFPTVTWTMIAGCAIVNATNATIGRGALSIPVSGEIERVLRLSPRSANGHNVIVDSNGFLLGTTFKEPFFRRVNATDTTGGFSCSSSATLQVQVVPAIIGCRYSTTTYPYAPLQALGLRFPYNKTWPLGAATVSVPDIGDYFVVGRRLTTAVSDLELHIISFVPKSDLLGAVDAAQASAIAICIVVLILASAASFFLINRVLRPLETLVEGMNIAAELERLDCEDGELPCDDEHATALALRRANRQLAGNSAELVTVPARPQQQQPSAQQAARDGTSVTVSPASLDANGGGGGANAAAIADGRAGSGNADGVAPPRPDDASSQASRSSRKSRLSALVASLGDDASSSWVSEIATVENAYHETLRSFTNLTRYVPRGVVRELIKQRQAMRMDEIAPGLEHREGVSVLMADIAGLDQPLRACADDAAQSAVLWQVLHIYLRRTCRILMAHGGIIDRLIGDCVICFWGAPEPCEAHALLAVLAALALQREARRDPLAGIFKEHLDIALAVRIGIASGSALVGSIPVLESSTYSLLGPIVKVARALCNLNRRWGTGTLVEEQTMRACWGAVHGRLMGNCNVHGSRYRAMRAARLVAVSAGAASTGVADDDGGGAQPARPSHAALVYEPIGLDVESEFVRQHVPRASARARKRPARAAAATAAATARPSAMPAASSDAANSATAENDRDDEEMAAAYDGLDEAATFTSATAAPSTSDATATATVAALTDVADRKSIRASDLVQFQSANRSSLRSVAALLRWHITRTVADPVAVRFAESFSRAARHLIDMRFHECLRTLQELEVDGAFSLEMVTRPFVTQLYDMASHHVNVPPRSRTIANDEFVINVVDN